jgi:tRNA-Thr(GGU) m(6)t(6)A37 methyltransferase TsaA
VHTQPFEVRPIGWVESPLRELDEAPRQGDEGAPSAWLVFHPDLEPALRDLRIGDRVILLTWLHRANRDVLTTLPRSDPSRAPTGVFSTRSPDRPNPIGLHSVEILAITGPRIQVSNLEALDQTPIVDLKPELGPVSSR